MSVCCLHVIFQYSFILTLLKMEITDPVLPGFGLLLYRFSGHNFPKCGQLDLKFVPVIQCNAMIIFLTAFVQLQRIGQNWDKKLIFGVIFRSFSSTPSYALRVAPQFLRQIKGLMKIHNRGKFHLYSICGSQVIKFQIVSWRCSIHEMAHFGVFLSPFSPK